MRATSIHAGHGSLFSDDPWCFNTPAGKGELT